MGFLQGSEMMVMPTLPIKMPKQLIRAEAEPVSAVKLIVFAEGDEIKVSTGSGVRFMLMAGAPIREPIAPYGPFVMNTDAEIRQVLFELRNGTFIKEEAAA